MGLPVSIKEFTKNPIPTIALLAMAGLIYLYIDVRSTMQSQIDSLQVEVTQLKLDNKELQRQYIELAKSIK